MGAFLKMEGVDGESRMKGYEGWVVLTTASSPIHRSIPAGARGVDREKGSTTLGEMVITRGVDKSSVKLAERCAKGKIIDEVQVHFTSMQEGGEAAFMTYKLKNVIATNWSFNGKYEDQTPLEDLTLNYESVEWTYTVFENGKKKGQVSGSFSPNR
jgi:type VI secretion system secreted protein Hcp